MTSPAHTLIGELLSATLDVHHSLPTITLHLQQRVVGYTHQRIIALRSYQGTASAARQAQHDHAALRCGQLYSVTADAVSSTAGAVYLLGVQGVQPVDLPPPQYIDARTTAFGLTHCPSIGLALSLPAMMAATRGAA